MVTDELTVLDETSVKIFENIIKDHLRKMVVH